MVIRMLVQVRYVVDFDVHPSAWTVVDAQNSNEPWIKKGPVFLSFDEMEIADFVERFRVRMSSVFMSALQPVQSAVHT